MGSSNHFGPRGTKQKLRPHILAALAARGGGPLLPSTIKPRRNAQHDHGSLRLFISR
jgi:hypothetical protein